MKNGLTTVPQIGSGNATQYTESASFAEVVGSSLQYKYGPAFDYIKNSMEFGMSPNTMLPQEGYIPKDNIPTDLRQFASQLLRASNPKQMDHMVTQIRKGQESRRVLAEAGFVSNLAAEFLDPFNYLGIPFIRGASVATNALRGSASVASVTAAQEAIRAPLDPLNTTAEVAINIGAAAILGGAITGLASVPMARRISAQEQATKTVEKLQSEITPNSTNLNAAGSLEAVQPSVAVEPNGSIAENWFTDSIVYKSIVTPLKAIIGDSKYPNSVKLTALKIINDSGILLAANKEGKKIGNSVGQNAKLFDGEWIRNYDEIINIWGDSTGKGVANPMDYMLPKHQKNFESWFEEIDKKAISGIKPANDLEAKVMKIQNDFYEMWQKRLTDVGEIGTTPQYSKMIAAREIRITKAQKRLEGKISIDQRLKLEASVTRHSKEIDDMKGVIEDLKDKTVMPPNEKIFRPRYWDQKSIKENKENFKSILVKWYTNNPSIISRGKDGKFGRVTLATDSISINRRADETIDTILGIKDILDPEIAYYGAGKSKHFKHRGVDIPNGLVLDFIQTNPVAVMKAYTKRVGPSYEFSRQFNGDSIEDVIDDAYDQMMDAGLSVTEAHKAAKNLRHLHQRLAGNVNRNPESWDQGFAKLLRDLAQLNYLGSAFQAALVEPSKIIMEHGLGPTMKGLFSVLKDNQLKMGANESRIAAEGVENIMNSAHIRMADDLNNNPFNSDILDKVKQPYYLLNGLGPITKILKDFDAMMRSHTLIDYSVRWTQGKATKMEQEYLLRYNIDLTDANKIASAPWQKSSSGMYMANTDAWTNAIEFPSTTAEIISGPTGVTRKDGSYSPAFYRSTDNKVFIDEEHIIKEMYPLRGWENPRVEGVKAIEAGIINSPDDYVAFIKMHEIMHSINKAKDLDLFIGKVKIKKYDGRKKEHLAAYENAINDLSVAQFKSQTRVLPETVQTFRSALSGGIMNTILMGTPADKPIITDGIVYIPMRVAGQFGMKEDSAFKGYARIENGLLGLPFQFFSYSFAALNKTTAAMAHGQLKSQFVGSAAALGLGYMVLQIKKPEYVEMSFQDQLARAFDYSGLAALHSDLFYTAMSTALALGGANITGGLLEPRYPQGPDPVAAATGLLGAGPNIGADLATSIGNLLTGNVGEGSKEFIKNLPFARLWFLKGHVNDLTNMLSDKLEEPSGFKRY